ncbi:MAG: hypothetical protein WCP38_02435, partial [Chloroflexota bacterium]
MPKRGLIALVLTLAGLRLIVAYSPPGGDIGLGGTTPDPNASPSAGPTSAPSGGGATPTPTPTKKPKPSKAPTGTLKDGTYDGDAVAFRYGTAQVEIVVSGGVITEVKALQLPTGGGYTARVTNFFKTQVPSRVVADQGWKISSVGG